MKIYRISYEMPRHNSPYWTEVDKNTKMVGKIKTVTDAKRMLGMKNLPSPGHESLVDQGIVNLSYTPKNSHDKPMTYTPSTDGIPRQYKTYLQNNAGTFRVWTWISPL